MSAELIEVIAFSFKKKQSGSADELRTRKGIEKRVLKYLSLDVAVPCWGLTSQSTSGAPELPGERWRNERTGWSGHREKCWQNRKGRWKKLRYLGRKKEKETQLNPNWQFVARTFVCVWKMSQMWHYNCEPSDRKGDAIICSEREMMCIRCGRRGAAPSLPQAIPSCGSTSRCQGKGDTNGSLGGKGWMGWRECLRAVASFFFCFFFPCHGSNIATRTVFIYRDTTSNSQKAERVNIIPADGDVGTEQPPTWTESTQLSWAWSSPEAHRGNPCGRRFMVQLICWGCIFSPDKATVLICVYTLEYRARFALEGHVLGGWRAHNSRGDRKSWHTDTNTHNCSAMVRRLCDHHFISHF